MLTVFNCFVSRYDFNSSYHRHRFSINTRKCDFLTHNAVNWQDILHFIWLRFLWCQLTNNPFVKFLVLDGSRPACFPIYRPTSDYLSQMCSVSQKLEDTNSLHLHYTLVKGGILHPPADWTHLIHIISSWKPTSCWLELSKPALVSSCDILVHFLSFYCPGC